MYFFTSFTFTKGLEVEKPTQRYVNCRDSRDRVVAVSELARATRPEVRELH